MVLHHYRLLDTLKPTSEGDVKVVIPIGDSHLASASRDKTVKLWARTPADSDEKDTYFQLQALFGGHGEYVNSLAHIHQEGKLGYLASGGIATVILLHNLDTQAPEAEHCLIGHTSNVCALRYSSKLKQLVSGSWDFTARVWEQTSSQWKCQVVLEGHEQAVWDVQILDSGPKEGCFLTGSADRSIRLWSSSGEPLARFKGCPQPVRGLTLLPGSQQFASASNDGALRIWDLEGTILATLEGHTDYVYHVEWGRNNRLLSCGEDKTVRVWDSKGNLEATLLHPCTSVWSVTSFDEDLIISAGSDGHIRVWGKSAVEPTDAVTNSTEIGESAVTEEASVGSESSRLQTQQEAQAAGPNRLVIDIDYADDQPPVQCVHDREADPRATAEAFVREHSLSENYIDKIAEFIRGHM